MKLKKLLILVAVLAVIGALSLAKKNNLEKAGTLNGRLVLAQTEPLLAKDFSQGFVTKMDVYRAGDPSERLLFAKDVSGKWVLQNHDNEPTRNEAVDSLLKSMTELRGELRSEDAAVLGDYSLKDEQAFHFQFFGNEGTELAHVLVSPLRPRGTQNFVRLAGSNKALVTDTDILASLSIFSPQDRLEKNTFAAPAPAAPAPAAPAPTAPVSSVKKKSG